MAAPMTSERLGAGERASARAGIHDRRSVAAGIDGGGRNSRRTGRLPQQTLRNRAHALDRHPVRRGSGVRGIEAVRAGGESPGVAAGPRGAVAVRTGLRGRPRRRLPDQVIPGPRALDSFARREMDAREKWEITPIAQNVNLAFAGMRGEIVHAGARVILDESIDVLYRREEGDILPMRLAYVPDQKYSTDEFRFEAGLMMSLIHQPKEEAAAAVDSLQTNVRRVIARRVDGKQGFKKPTPAGLNADRAAESSKQIAADIAKEVRGLLKIATSGEISARPGEWCARCDFGSICRQALNADILSSRWEFEEDEEEKE